MYVCRQTWMSLFLGPSLPICVCTHTLVFMYVCLDGWRDLGRCMWIHIWMGGCRQNCVNIYIYIYIYICMLGHLDACSLVYIHTYKHTYIQYVIPGNMSFKQVICK